MTRREFYYKSADLKTDIYGVEICPDEDVLIRGVIQIAHGLSENSRIYEPVADVFAKAGYVVRLNDHIGHGKSCKEGQTRNYLGGPGSFSYAVSDLHTLRTMEGVEGLPYYLLGHSMGAFLVREYLMEYDDADGAIISGSSVQPAIALKGMRLLLNGQAKKFGYDGTPDFVQTCMHGTNNKKIKSSESEFDWILKDPVARQEFVTADDLGGRITTGIFYELTGAMLRTQDPKGLSKIRKDIPILFLAGGEDASVDFGKAIEPTIQLYHQYVSENVVGKLYTGSRHCIFQDAEKEQVVADVLKWLEGTVRV